MEKYSVLMSLYMKERPEYLERSIQSMIGQTLKPDEIVIVRDGPITPELESVLHRYLTAYPGLFHIVELKENRGLGAALNYGLEHCRNELVARMDTDDIAKPYRCEKQIRYFQSHKNTSILGGQIEEFMGSEDNIVGKRVVPETDTELKNYMKKRCPFNHMTVMFKKSHVLEAGSYRDWFWNEDYYLWIRIAIKKYEFANLPDILVNARVGADMYQRRGGKKYFKSEMAIQKFMLRKKLIRPIRYALNVGERAIVELLLPNNIRSWVFRRFARQ